MNYAVFFPMELQLGAISAQAGIAQKKKSLIFSALRKI
jgi:hypothetical protein